LPAFLKEAFAELRRRGTKNLIIDMRGNTGGSAAGPPLLFSYLTSKEFRTTEHMRATTFQPTFKQHTAQDIDPEKDSYYGSAAGYWKTGPDGRWLATEKDATLGVQKPSENPFDGTVYVLIDGAGLSATMVFCSTADFHKRATFVGEETGGLADILLGTEESTSPTLPASRLYVPIPSQARLLVVDRSNRRRGVLPKYRVTQTVGDLAKRRDTVLEFTRELIRTGKTR
jgi:C-terminal processing protease CtpA/Prc